MFDTSGSTDETPRECVNVAAAWVTWSFMVTIPFIFRRARKETLKAISEVSFGFKFVKKN